MTRAAGSPRRWVLTGAAAAALIGGGIAVVATSTADPAGNAVATGQPSSGPVSESEVPRSGGTGDVGDPAPAVTITALDGYEVELPTDLPAVVFFFAGWCTTCVPEAQALGQLQDELGDTVVILAVDVDPTDTTQTIENFMAAAGDPPYPVAHDLNGALTQAFNVAALDTTVIINADGTVVYRDAVPTTLDQLRDAMRLAGA